jgi:hypothetical protein
MKRQSVEFCDPNFLIIDFAVAGYNQSSLQEKQIWKLEAQFDHQ